MMNTLSKINLSKIEWEGGWSTLIWIMSLNILFVFLRVPLTENCFVMAVMKSRNQEHLKTCSTAQV